MELVAQIAMDVSDAADERAARHAYRRSFNRLRSQLQLYPDGSRPSEVFENAAATVRSLGANCLPLAIAVAMHLYPFCVLQSVPIPLLSVARLKRAMLLRTIRNRSLLLANTGSERSSGTTTPPIATRAADGVRIDGRCEYLSLSSVADIVLFKAQLADSNHAVLCAADLRASTVRIGPWKFSGAMELSDTSAVTFVNHRVPDGHYLIVPDDAGLGCITDYQRSWFHLFIAEIYLARVEHLTRWQIQRPRKWRIAAKARAAAIAASARRIFGGRGRGAAGANDRGAEITRFDDRRRRRLPRCAAEASPQKPAGSATSSRNRRPTTRFWRVSRQDAKSAK